MLEGYKREMDALLERHPTWPDLHNSRGLIAHVLGDDARACSLFQRALALNPRYLEARINLQFALHRAGQREEADSAMARMREEMASNLAVLLAHGMYCAEQGRLDPAQGSLSRATALNPYHAPAWHARGIAASLAGDPTGAQASFNSAISLRPEYEADYRHLGIRVGHVDRQNPHAWNTGAVRRHAWRLVRNPYLGRLFIRVGLFLAKEGAWRLAEQAFAEGMDARSDFAELYWALGQLAADDGDLALASSLLRSGTEADPHHFDCRKLLAQCLTRSGQSEAAAAELQQAVQLRPRYPDLRALLAELLLEAGRLDEARAEAEEALAISPAYTRAHVLRGHAAYRMQDYDQALQAYSSASTQADCPRLDLHRAAALLGKGDPQDAFRLLEVELPEELTDPAHLFLLAAASERLGKLQTATALLERYLEIEEDDRRRGRVRGLLDSLEAGYTGDWSPGFLGF